MASNRFIEYTCDRCGRRQEYETLSSFQSDRWRTVSYKPVGSSDDHPDRFNDDLCPKCGDEYFTFLSHSRNQAAIKEAADA